MNINRADKHGFFISAQVICSLEGIIYHVALGLGHNNDKGMLILTGMKDFLVDNDLYWLADSGYSNTHLVTSSDKMPITWNHQQKGMRSIADTVIGFVKRFSLAAMTFRQSPELQQVSLMVIYQLANKRLLEYPLRLET